MRRLSTILAAPTLAAPTLAAETTAGARVAQRRVLILVTAMALVTATLAASNSLSWRTIGLNYDWLSTAVGNHGAVALLAFIVGHVAIVAVGVPGGGILAVTAGLLFGWQTGIVAALTGAVGGASALLLLARGPLQRALRSRSQHPWVDRMRKGFAQDGLSYLIVLRLIGIPGAIVNLGAAALGMRLKPFVIGTVIGILPPITAFAYLGATLGGGIAAQNAIYRACTSVHPLDADAACPYGIDWSAFPGRELMLAIGLIVGVALLPMMLRKRSAPHATV